MIKLIASDMDGSLLDDEKRLPPDFFPVLDDLLERGIVFAAASGRTYSALEHYFSEEYKKKTAFICDNGACTYLNGKLLNVFPLERQIYERFIEACVSVGGFTMVVCGENGVFHLDKGEEFYGAVGKFYKYHKNVKSLDEIEGVIYKVAVCDERGAAEHGKPILDGIFGSALNIQVSGEIWMDVMSGGVSKGAALEDLQRRLGILPEQTMAFGDYFNDVDMLRRAEYSFCMENGHEDVKKLTRFIAPDNNSHGVTKCIKEHLEIVNC